MRRLLWTNLPRRLLAFDVAKKAFSTVLICRRTLPEG
jgi:hypothetical protein